MKIPRYARYEFACEKAIEFSINESIHEFPINAIKLIKDHRWAIVEYSKLASKHDVTILDVCETFGSTDGYTTYSGRNYTIGYNDTIQSKGRMYFTLLHEIGHIVLNHFVDFEQTILSRSGLSKTEYQVLENEANCFARNIVAPATLVQEIKLKGPTQIVDCFEITFRASETRLGLLKNDLKQISGHYKQLQVSKFKNFIYKKLHSKYCSVCDYSFTSETAKFCPICGYKRLLRNLGDDSMLYNDGYDLDSNGRTCKCPECENEEMLDRTSYCRICGTFLINKCTNEPFCGNPVAGNARFCEYCGTQTTFSKSGLLKDWAEVKQEIIEKGIVTAVQEFDNVEFLGLDEDHILTPIDDDKIPF